MTLQGHAHFFTTDNEHYSVLLSSRAQETVFQYCQQVHVQDILHDLFYAQVRSFLAQVLFVLLPTFRAKHLFQHNDLKTDNLVVTHESEHTILWVQYKRRQQTVTLRIPTYPFISFFFLK